MSMTFKAKLLQKYDPVRCVGDILHNELLDTLFEGVDKRSTHYKKVSAFLDSYLDGNNQNWIDNVIPGYRLKKLNAIMKAKTPETFQKRVKALIHQTKYGTHYGLLFNRQFIAGLEQFVEKETA